MSIQKVLDYSDFPVKSIFSELEDKLSKQNKLILTSPPGSGKSTLTPLLLSQLTPCNSGKILMLEPRRLAAKSLAVYLSSLLGEEVGNTVGYRIRFDSKISDNTKIEIVTEGILTRMLQNDNTLEDYSAIIFDEFHERNIHSDVGLAFCLEIQEVLREDLKLIIMSATINSSELSNQLDAPVVSCDGKLHPVEIKYSGAIDKYSIAELTANQIIKAVNEHDGDLLAFFPGQAEILRCKDLLNPLSGFDILPLYGNLPFKEQQKVLKVFTDSPRRIILATSIAETSLTIERIKIVVDTGLGRTSIFDSKTNLSRLETIHISKDSADQRAGRAGRLSEGVCYRMWSKADHDKLKDHRIPEISQADLTSLCLDLYSWGIKKTSDLKWITIPDAYKISFATEYLKDVSAIDDSLNLTDHGKAVHQMACHPRIAHMLIKSQEEGLEGLACDLAALLEEKDPMINDGSTDINIRIETLRKYRSRGQLGKKWNRIEKLAAYNRKLINCEVDNSSYDVFETGLLLSFAFPDRIAFAKPGNNAQFQLANGKQASIHHSDDMAHEPWIVVASLTDRDKSGRIFLASPLNPKDLANQLKEYDNVKWSFNDDKFIANKELRIGHIVLKSSPIKDISQSQKEEAIISAIKKDPWRLLNQSDDLDQFISRNNSLAHWLKNDGFKVISKESIIDNCEKWLSPYLSNISTTSDLKKLDLATILFNDLEWTLQEQFNSLAPLKVEVPSGSKIKLEYQDNGEAPILKVRLQEIFGLLESPKVCNNSIAILIHVLSPGFKLVQITGDLKSFWNEGYFHVKKELKGRYPKHHWPDKPLEATATRTIKKKN